MGAAISAVGSLIGIGVGAVGSAKQARAEKKIAKLRRQQLGLDVARRRRDILREEIIKRAEIENAAAARGVSTADSSVKGGLANTFGNARENILYLKQDKDITMRIFRKSASAAAGGVLANIGSGIQSLGSVLGSLGRSPSFGG
jgi:hypothetical protein